MPLGLLELGLTFCSLRASPHRVGFRSGGNSPSYVYRLLGEYYHEDDYKL
eukprot:m.206698 g.206698  ORF g.206698 m.206698 type:complete len:50 (-) comp53898_c0_seq4:71-220(-)